MTGLLLKDLYTIKRQYKVIGILAVIYLIMAYTSEDPSIMISVMVIVAIMMPITCIAYEERCKWNGYVNALPVSKKTQVAEKYLFPVLLAGASDVVLVLVAYLLMAIKKIEIDYVGPIYTSIAIISSGILMLSILLPLVYKFGVEKARLGLFVIAALVGLISIAFSNGFVKLKEQTAMPPELAQLSDFIEQNTFTVLAAAFCLVSVIYIISFFVSLMIEKKKEY